MKFDKISFAKYEGSISDFTKEIKVGPSDFSVAVGKVKNGKSFTYIWFEDKEKWTVNIADGTSSEIKKESNWITERNLNNYVHYLISLGYDMLKITK